MRQQCTEMEPEERSPQVAGNILTNFKVVKPLSTTAAVPPGELHKGPGQRSRKIRPAAASPLRVLQVIRDKELFT